MVSRLHEYLNHNGVSDDETLNMFDYYQNAEQVPAKILHADDIDFGFDKLSYAKEPDNHRYLVTQANFLSVGSITLRMTRLNASAQSNNSMVLVICIGFDFMTFAAFCRCRSGIHRTIKLALKFGIKLMAGRLLRLLINMTPIMRLLRPDGG